MVSARRRRYPRIEDAESHLRMLLDSIRDSIESRIYGATEKVQRELYKRGAVDPENTAAKLDTAIKREFENHIERLASTLKEAIESTDLATTEERSARLLSRFEGLLYEFESAAISVRESLLERHEI